MPQHELERAPDVLGLGRLEIAPAVDGRVAGRQQQGVALPQDDLEHAGQEQDHLAARMCAASLEKAEVTGGDRSLGGQRQLAHPAGHPPVPEQGSEGGGGGSGPLIGDGASHADSVRERDVETITCRVSELLPLTSQGIGAGSGRGDAAYVKETAHARRGECRSARDP